VTTIIIVPDSYRAASEISSSAASTTSPVRVEPTVNNNESSSSSTTSSTIAATNLSGKEAKDFEKHYKSLEFYKTWESCSHPPEKFVKFWTKEAFKAVIWGTLVSIGWTEGRDLRKKKIWKSALGNNQTLA
jgi:hypothetical protein